jgi:glycosyltransferase involved in cell wall biosynthesis
MRVALLASAFHPHVGGVEEVVRQLAHGLRRAGHEPIVLTNRWPRDLPVKEDFEGIPVYRPAFRAPEGGFKARLTYRLTNRAITRQVDEILRQRRIDVINVHCVSANALYGMRASRDLRLPLVVTSHSERIMDRKVFEHSPFMTNVLRQALGGADYVIGCSRATLEDLITFTQGNCGAASRVLYNGIDLGEFSSGPSHAHPRPYVLALGRMVKPKGFDILLNAFARSGIAATHDLILAGDGPEKASLEAQVQALNLGRHVHLPGRADRARSLALMKGAEFFVMPSRDEGFPMVCLEAMGSAKAIVGTAVGGVPESVLDGETGLLVEKEDPGALASAIARLAQDAGLSRRLGVAGRKRVEQWSWESITRQYLDVYAAVTAGAPAHILPPTSTNHPCTT